MLLCKINKPDGAPSFSGKKGHLDYDKRQAVRRGKDNLGNIQEMISASDFTSLFDDYYPRLYAYVRSRVADQDTAEDITAATFERAFGRRHTFDPARGSFATWLFRIARNLTVNHYASLSRQPAYSDLDDAPQVSAPGLSPEQLLLRQEQHRALLEAIRILSERDQEIIRLRFFGRLTNRKIAEIMDLKERTVSVIILRALQKLQIHLEKQEAP